MWHPSFFAEMLAAKISHVLYVKVSVDPAAKELQADKDHQQTGGMYLRVIQFKVVCTVDACIAKFARDERTPKLGQGFHDAVSGRGVWQCVHFECRALPIGPSAPSPFHGRSLQDLACAL